MKKLIFLICAILIEKFKGQECNIGCLQCYPMLDNQKQICTKCLDGYLLSEGLCIYQLCQPNLYFQIKGEQDDKNEGTCKSICDPLFSSDEKTNVCKQLDSCSSIHSTQRLILNDRIPIDFFVYKEQYYVAQQQGYLSIYNKKNLDLIKNLSFYQDDLHVQELNDQILVLEKDFSINVWDLINERRYQIYQMSVTPVSQQIQFYLFLEQYLLICQNEQLSAEFQIVYDFDNQQQMVSNSVQINSSIKSIQILNSYLFLDNQTNLTVNLIIFESEKMNLKIDQLMTVKFENQENLKSVIQSPNNTTLYITIFTNRVSIIDVSGQIQLDLIKETTIKKVNIIQIENQSNETHLITQTEENLIDYDFQLKKSNVIFSEIQSITDFEIGNFTGFKNELAILVNKQEIKIYNLNRNSYNQQQTISLNSPSESLKKISTSQIKKNLKNENTFEIVVFSTQQIQIIRQNSISISQLEKTVIQNYYLPYPTPSSNVNSMTYVYSPLLLVACHQNGDILFYDASRGTDINLLKILSFSNEECILLQSFSNNNIAALVGQNILLIDSSQQIIIKQINNLQNIVQMVSNSDKLVILYNNCIQILSSEFISLFLECSTIFSSNNLNIALNNNNNIIIQKQNQIAVYEVELSNNSAATIKYQIQTPNLIQYFNTIKVYQADEDIVKNNYFIDEIIYFDDQKNFNIYSISLQKIYDLQINLVSSVFSVKRVINDSSVYFLGGYQISTQSYILFLVSKTLKDPLFVVGSPYFLYIEEPKKLVNGQGITYYGVKRCVLLVYFTLFEEYRVDIERRKVYTAGIEYLANDGFSTSFNKRIGTFSNYINYVGTKQGLIYTIQQQKDRYQELSTNTVLSSSKNDDEIKEIIQNSYLGIYLVRTKYQITSFNLFTNQFIEYLQPESSNDSPFTSIRLVEGNKGLICWNQNQLLYVVYGKTSQKYYYKGMTQINGWIFNPTQNNFYIYGSTFQMLNSELKLLKTSQNNMNFIQCQDSSQQIICIISIEQLVIIQKESFTFQKVQINGFTSEFRIFVDEQYQNIFLYNNLIQVYSFKGAFNLGYQLVTEIISFSTAGTRIIIQSYECNLIKIIFILNQKNILSLFTTFKHLKILLQIYLSQNHFFSKKIFGLRQHQISRNSQIFFQIKLFKNEIIFFILKQDLYFIERESLILQDNYIQGPSGFQIKSYYFIDFQQMIILTTNFGQFAQLYIYSSVNLQNIGKINGVFPNNEIGDVVDMFFDYATPQILYLDKFGNVYTFDLFLDIPVQNIYKITEVSDRNEQLIGFSYDNITNNVLVYTNHTIYQIDYTIDFQYEAQLNEQKKLFTSIQIDRNTLEFLIFNKDNIVYRYSKYSINFEQIIEGSEIVDIQYYMKTDTLIIAQKDQIQFYQNYQQSITNNNAHQINLQKIQFFKFLLPNIYLTYDKKVIQCNLLNGEIINTIQLQASVIITLASEDQNQIFIGLSNGQLLHYNLINLASQYFTTQNINSIYNSVISIILNENLNTILFVTNGGMLQETNLINKQTIQELNLIDLVNEDPSSTLKQFIVDQVYQRYIFLFNGQKKVYVWNYNTKKQEQYLALSKNQGKIKLIDNLIIIFSALQLNIYQVSEQISLITGIRRNLSPDQITNCKVINSEIVVLFFISKFEILLLQNNQTQMIYQQQYSYPRYLGSIYNKQANILTLYGLHHEGVFENNFSLSIYDNNQSFECSLTISDNDISQLNQKISNISPKQELVFRFLEFSTQNQQNWSNLIYLQVQNEQFQSVNQYIYQNQLKNFQFLFYPFSNNKNLTISAQTFQFFQQSILQMFDFNLIFLNNQRQNLITFSKDVQKFILKNIIIHDQCIDSVQITISQVEKVILESMNISSLKICSQDGNMQVSSLLNFVDIPEVFIYDLDISQSILLSNPIYSIFTFKNVKKIVINGLNIQKNKNISSFFQFTNINSINITNLNVSDNQNSQTSNQQRFLQVKVQMEIFQSQSIFNFFGCEKVQIQNSLFKNNRLVSLIQSFNQFVENNQVTVFFDDEFSLKNIVFSSNQNQKDLLMILNTNIHFYNLTHLQNQGVFTISQSQSVLIEQSIFQNNFAQNGGAISFSGSKSYIKFIKCLFQKNIAFSSGGALYFKDISSTLIQFDEFTKIIENEALIGGGIRIVQINSDGLLELPPGYPFQQNVYDNKASIFGDNSATYLQKILIQENNTLKSQNNYQFKFYNDNSNMDSDQKLNYFSKIEINYFQSGGQLSLQMHLVDENNRYLSFSLQNLITNYYPEDITNELKSIQIIVNNLDTQKTQLIGEKILNYNQYNSENQSFELTGLYIQGVLSSQQLFSIDSSIFTKSQIQFPILLSIHFRECVIGEIIQKQINDIKLCKFCQQGTYSLVNPNFLYKQSQNTQSGIQNECNNCPSSVLECQGSFLQLKNGYWRKNNLTDEIVQCNQQIGSCQAEVPSSINYCAEGYIGPLCQTCDYLGEIWKGSRYSETIKKGFCQECYQIGIQITYFILKIIGMIAYFLFTTFVFISQFKYTQTCYYLRKMKLLPISKSSINDYSGFYIKIIITYFQISSLLLPQSQILPVNVNILNEFLGQTSRQLSLGMECMASIHTIKSYGQLIFFSLAELLFMVILFLLVIAILGSLQIISRRKQIKKYHYLTFFHVFLIFYQIGQISYFSKSLTCIQVGSESLNPYDLSIKCDDPSTIKFVYPYSISVLLFWTLLPLFLLFKVVKKKGRLNDCNVKYFYGYYYGELKNEYYYWEFIRIYLKIALIYLHVLVSQTSTIKVISNWFVIGIYIIILRKRNPFISQKIQHSEIQAYSLLILKIYLSEIDSGYGFKKCIEIIILFIDFLFFFICGFTIMIFKARQGVSFSSSLFRSILKKCFTNNFYSKLVNQKTTFQTYLKWKYIKSNIYQIIQLQASQNSHRVATRLNSLSSNLQRDSYDHSKIFYFISNIFFNNYQTNKLENQKQSFFGSASSSHNTENSNFYRKQNQTNFKLVNYNTFYEEYTTKGCDFIIENNFAQVAEESDTKSLKKYSFFTKPSIIKSEFS